MRQQLIPLAADEKGKLKVSEDSRLALRHQQYLEAATAENTRRAYQSAIRHFEQWGGYLPASANMVQAYLLAHAQTLNPRTLSLRLTALRHWHQLQGFPDPTASPQIRKTLQGIIRVHGRPKRQAKVFQLEHLEMMINQLSESSTLKDLRDKALLLIGFFGAFRRNELVAIKVEEIHWEPEGMVIVLPRSKTDPNGEGKFKALPVGEGVLCPITALKQWLQAAKINSGSIFRRINRWEALLDTPLHPASVTFILKRVAEQVGFGFVPELSSHSLRRSLATSAYRAGASFESIKRQGGWSHDRTVWSYIEAAQYFEDNAASALLTKSR
ncbi:integrase family protein [Candidatus Nitrosoglobus terrae]|uniref:Integrase family protein n=1 Tax=Candidatus Nitrosoglobus terrae TaxID=1630141 RepID=A0A1Q2SKJ8_9GAMM|nr:site-specific integrase [Candidatus Nitrosoglobus terrae]BAW79644.1 integrase family protein [Candidatus Nitrosoglobus terrae]